VAALLGYRVPVDFFLSHNSDKSGSKPCGGFVPAASGRLHICMYAGVCMRAGAPAGACAHLGAPAPARAPAQKDARRPAPVGLLKRDMCRATGQIKKADITGLLYIKFMEYMCNES